MTLTAKPVPSPFAENLRQAREGAGMSRDRAARRLEVDFGINLSDETIRRYEAGYYTEATADPLVIMALADIYRVRPSSISKVVTKRAKTLRDLLVRMSPWITPDPLPAFAAA